MHLGQTFSTKDGEAASRIRNGDWMQEQNAERWFIEESAAKLEKSEILESKYPMYAWGKRTLARRLQYFGIN